jgi:hypothetical protein
VAAARLNAAPPLDRTKRGADTRSEGERGIPIWPSYHLVKDADGDPNGDLYYTRTEAGEILSWSTESGLADLVLQRDANPTGRLVMPAAAPRV